jgi:hypothetical protein
MKVNGLISPDIGKSPVTVTVTVQIMIAVYVSLHQRELCKILQIFAMILQ